jgi:hypothetical protein
MSAHAAIPNRSPAFQDLPVGHVTFRASPKEQGSAGIAQAFMRSGGINSGGGVAELMPSRHVQPPSPPMVQFNRPGMAIRRRVKEVLVDLRGKLDENQLARRFIEPHTALNGQEPADLISTAAPTVCRASRISRPGQCALPAEH